jgi:hypothetical protein
MRESKGSSLRLTYGYKVLEIWGTSQFKVYYGEGGVAEWMTTPSSGSLDNSAEKEKL